MTKAANLAALAQGPAFSAYANTTQSISNSTQTKILFQTEEFDTNNNFDNATNYRFQPTVAGYYQISGCVYIQSLGAQSAVHLYKNGSSYKATPWQFAQAGGDAGNTISTVVYLNGSTDYVELYAIQNSGVSKTVFGGVGATASTWFNGALVRAA